MERTVDNVNSQYASRGFMVEWADGGCAVEVFNDDCDLIAKFPIQDKTGECVRFAAIFLQALCETDDIHPVAATLR